MDVVREGKNISLFARGHMVWRALEAAEQLAKEDGCRGGGLHIGIIKPLDTDEGPG